MDVICMQRKISAFLVCFIKHICLHFTSNASSLCFLFPFGELFDIRHDCSDISILENGFCGHWTEFWMSIWVTGRFNFSNQLVECLKFICIDLLQFQPEQCHVNRVKFIHWTDTFYMPFIIFNCLANYFPSK